MWHPTKKRWCQCVADETFITAPRRKITRHGFSVQRMIAHRSERDGAVFWHWEHTKVVTV